MQTLKSKLEPHLLIFLPFQLITPANTPATPPNFPDALNMLANLSTSDKMATSPLATSSLSPRSNNQSRNSFSPMMSPPPPPPQFHQLQNQQQNQQQVFIQTNQNQLQQQPWRGQISPNAGFGPPSQPHMQQQNVCIQPQVLFNFPKLVQYQVIK